MSSSDIRQEIDLGGQVAIVTGAGRGIGRAMAQELAKAGAAVAVLARSEDQLTETVALIETEGGRAIALPADATEQQAMERAMAETECQLGPVDLLVDNAGGGGQVGPVWEVEPDDWWRCVEVNLRGPFQTSSIAYHRGEAVYHPSAQRNLCCSWPQGGRRPLRVLYQRR